MTGAAEDELLMRFHLTPPCVQKHSLLDQLPQPSKQQCAFVKLIGLFLVISETHL